MDIETLQEQVRDTIAKTAYLDSVVGPLVYENRQMKAQVTALVSETRDIRAHSAVLVAMSNVAMAQIQRLGRDLEHLRGRWELIAGPDVWFRNPHLDDSDLDDGGLDDGGLHDVE